MRRLMVALGATGLLLAFAPAALARHHSAGHHLKTHSHRAHIRRFGDPGGQSTTTSSPSNAGTVKMFDSTTGALTLLLNDGSTVTGTVTNDTQIECTSSSQSSSTSADDDSSEDQGQTSSGGDDQGDNTTTSGGDDQGNNTTTSGGDDQGDNTTTSGGDDQGNNTTTSGGDDQGDNQSGSSSTSCSSANLSAPNAAVAEAVLRISSAGNTWEKIELA